MQGKNEFSHSTYMLVVCAQMIVMNEFCASLTLIWNKNAKTTSVGGFIKVCFFFVSIHFFPNLQSRPMLAKGSISQSALSLACPTLLLFYLSVCLFVSFVWNTEVQSFRYLKSSKAFSPGESVLCSFSFFFFFFQLSLFSGYLGQSPFFAWLFIPISCFRWRGNLPA